MLISLNGGDLIEDTKITLNFREASLDGSAGCNTYGGSYTASEDSLRLNGVYATEMGCMEPKGILEQEKAYLDALNTAARYWMDDDRLEVYDEAGVQTLAFVAAVGPSSVRATPTPAINGDVPQDPPVAAGMVPVESIEILIGGLIGAEREYSDRAACFRTIIIICVETPCLRSSLSSWAGQETRFG